jgi:hypothetical protein
MRNIPRIRQHLDVQKWTRLHRDQIRIIPFLDLPAHRRHAFAQRQRPICCRGLNCLQLCHACFDCVAELCAAVPQAERLAWDANA